MDKITTGQAAVTRRGLLKFGLGTVVAATALGPGARIVLAQDG
jgi:hypothetical protein